MPGKGTEKHYAGRYICQRPNTRCGGKIWNGGERVPCPLREKCFAGKDELGGLEWLWPMGKYGRLLIESEPDWRKKHTERRRGLLQIFDGEGQREYYRERRKKNRDRINQLKREWRERKRKEAPPEVVTEPDRGDRTVEFGQGARHLLLPCGEDCRNCPLPGGPAECPYTDEDEDRLMELEYGR